MNMSQTGVTSNSKFISVKDTHLEGTKLRMQFEFLNRISQDEKKCISQSLILSSP